MYDIFDDEFKQIFEESEKESIQKSDFLNSLNEPINLLPKLEFISIQDNSNLSYVIKNLKKYNSGCILLENKNKISGIFTERDAMKKVLGQKLNLEKEPIVKYMTKSPECLRWEDPIVFALNKMVSGGYRHIPIIDEKKHPLGVISMQNIIHYLGDYFFDEIVNLPPKPLREQTSREGG
ncbi:MAG: hypothetical protein CMF96_01470 [Candidatus Marinimicrobia bacterium]|nr:hypothetical protein [Candidatus Neomarinimicrobiota bacterium]|tara:strand:- start:11246 stop:11782 length:537 start_codon:yes stop_codon:yes gene_type:complete